MNKKSLFLLLSVALVGCRNSRPTSDIVQESYVHKYGVPVAKADWEKQGKDGQVIYLRNDGVTITRSFVGGILHGKTTYSFPNSATIQKVENYNNGQLLVVVENYPSGVPKQQEELTGILKKVTVWYEDGTPQALENYENEKLTSGEYHTPLNVLESRITGGEGIRVIRDKDGMLVAKDNIQQGELREKVVFFPNGDPSAVEPYENGRIHGLRKTFCIGSLPNTVEQWVHGVQEGTTTYFQNGEKICEAPFMRGVKHGIELHFRNGSEIVQEVNWRNGVQHGPTKIHVGEMTRTEWYHQGELVSRNTYERMNLR